MMQPIFGNHKQRSGLGVFLSVCGLAIGEIAQACPACVVTKKNESLATDLFILSVMGIVPIVIAIWVFYKISRLQKNERNQKS